jgi:hypothetical protein
MFVCTFCVVLSCVGRAHVMDRHSVEGVLPNVNESSENMAKKFSETSRIRGCYTAYTHVKTYTHKMDKHTEPSYMIMCMYFVNLFF